MGVRQPYARRQGAARGIDQSARAPAFARFRALSRLLAGLDILRRARQVAGVLLASFLGVSSNNAGQLTASAFSIRRPRRPGRCLGLADGRVCSGTITGDHHCVPRSPPRCVPYPRSCYWCWWSLRYVQGFLRLNASPGADHDKPASLPGDLWAALPLAAAAATLPWWLSGYVLGNLTVNLLLRRLPRRPGTCCSASPARSTSALLS